MTIIEFLEARIAEDEAGGNYLLGREDDEANAYGEHFLAECAAKRAILSHYDDTVKWTRDPDCSDVQSYSDMAAGLMDSLRHLAAVYADHPDYQPEWAL